MIQRYWGKSTSDFKFSKEGYLIDPRENEYAYKEKDLVTFEDILKDENVLTLLLGESGMGKSHEIRGFVKKLEQNGKYNTLYLNLEFYSDQDDFENAKFVSDKLETNKINVIFIDSIEEKLSDLREIVKTLKMIIRENEKKTIQFIISCRTTYWGKSYEKDIEQALKNRNTKKYYLAPLTKENSMEYIENKLPEEEATNLLRNISAKRLASFARVPIQLELLIRSGMTKDTNFTRKELYLKGCKNLCSEQNGDRRFSIKPTEAKKDIETAQWIAYLSLLSNCKTIEVKQDIANRAGLLYVDDHIVSDLFEREDIMSVLNSDLFTKVSDSIYRWSHMSYAEYLCAKHITENFGVDVIEELIFHEIAQNRVIPAFREVASWIIQLDENSDVFERILENDFEIIYLSDLSSLSDTHKQKFIKHNLRIGGLSEYRDRLKRLDKSTLINCRFDGLGDFISSKTEAWLQYQENVQQYRNVSDNQVIIQERKDFFKSSVEDFYEVEGKFYKGKELYITDEAFIFLLEMGLNHNINGYMKLVVKYGMSYYNFEESLFKVFKMNASEDDIDNLIDIFINSDPKIVYESEAIRGQFVIYLSEEAIRKRRYKEALDLLKKYYSCIEADDYDKKLVSNMMYYIRRIETKDVFDWILSNMSSENDRLIDEVLQYIFNDDSTQISYTQQLELFHHTNKLNYSMASKEIIMNWITRYPFVIKEKINLSSNIKTIVDQINESGKVDTNKLNDGLFFKDEIDMENFNKQIPDLCKRVTEGDYSKWDKVCSMLDEYTSISTRVLSWGYESIIESIDWNKFSHTDKIINASEEYFRSYKGQLNDKIFLKDNRNHTMLLSILLKENPLAIENASDEVLKNWFYELLRYTPIQINTIKMLCSKFTEITNEYCLHILKKQTNPVSTFDNNAFVLKENWNDEYEQILIRQILDNEVSLSIKIEIVSFLYSIESDSIRSKLMNFLRNTSHSDDNILCLILNQLFISNDDDAFKFFEELSDQYEDFAIDFSKFMYQHNRYWDFLNEFNTEEISMIYQKIVDSTDGYIERNLYKVDADKGYNGKKFDFEYEDKNIRTSILSFLTNKDTDDGNNALFELHHKYPNDYVVESKAMSSLSRLSNENWKGISIIKLKLYGRLKIKPSDSSKLYAPDTIFNNIVEACALIQGLGPLNKCNEDDRNTMLAFVLSRYGYNVKDQTFWGRSKSKKSSGELDIAISNERDVKVSIIEALNLDCLNRTTINDHLKKIFDYDSNGLKRNYVLSYVNDKVGNFTEFWRDYYEYINIVDYPFVIKSRNEVEIEEFADIKAARTTHDRNGNEVQLIHVCVYFKTFEEENNKLKGQ
jgi:hypothetical protein